eukprot:403332528
MDFFSQQQQKGPLSVAHFTQPWNSKFQNFSTFFDSYSNTMILFRDGFFVIWDMYDKGYKIGENAFTINLATTYKQVFAASVHPEKNCLALQISENSLVILFLKENQAEEIKLTFAKAKMIHAFSFLFGDDYNFFVATNISIDLYKVKIDSLKAKLVKNMVISVQDPQFYYEPTASVVVVVDNRGQCYPYFLNLWDNKAAKGKLFQLDVSSVDPKLIQEANQSFRGSNRMSFGEKAMSFFKKPEIKFSLAHNTYNQNIQAVIQKQRRDNQCSGRSSDLNSLIQEQQAQMSNDSTSSFTPPTGISSNRRNQNQVLLTTMYHKVILLHYNPYTSFIEAYELDLTQTFKNIGHIQICHQSQINKDLIQMQVVDNLLVIHNLDSKSSQIYDLKLENWNVPLLSPDIPNVVEYGPTQKGRYISDLLAKEEMRYQEFLSNGLQGSLASVNMSMISQSRGGDLDSSRMSHMLDSQDHHDNRLSAQQISDRKQSDQIEDSGHHQIIQESTNQIRFEEVPINSDISKSSMLGNRLDNPDLKEYDIYDSESIVFVDPFIMIDVKNFSCLALRLKLERYSRSCADKGKMMLSLLCRSRNKEVFLKQLWELLLKQEINLIQMSSLFMRINQIYKQASIERQTYSKKKAASNLPNTVYTRIQSENYLHQGSYMELLIIELQRLSRLRANTSFISKTLNDLLLEYHPTNRVLTGECIVFQNEMLEIFKDLIANSTHPLNFEDGVERDYGAMLDDKKIKHKYVLSVILEFLRSLLENQIPQQSTQQNLLMKYILETKDFSTLQNLMQYRVLNENPELARQLIILGSNESKVSGKCYFEPAYQIGLDMLKKLKLFDEIVIALLNEKQILRALNFAQEYGIHSMKLSTFNEILGELRKDTKNRKMVEIFQRRIQEIRKYDEAKLKSERDYKPILVDE